MSLTIAEYFAGIGLVRMGLQPSGWRVLFANDISLKKYVMYEAFFPDAANHYVVDDVFRVAANQIPPTTLATCSFPCIDLSLAGNMNGIIDGEHSSAFWGFAKILQAQDAAAPPYILVENVPGWLYSNDGADFRATVKAINVLGYACDVFVLTDPYGWIRGVVHHVREHDGAVVVEVKKVRRGKREYLPRGAKSIWPDDWRFGLTIAAEDLDNAHIQPDSFTRAAAP